MFILILHDITEKGISFVDSLYTIQYWSLGSENDCFIPHSQRNCVTFNIKSFWGVSAMGVLKDWFLDASDVTGGWWRHCYVMLMTSWEFVPHNLWKLKKFGGVLAMFTNCFFQVVKLRALERSWGQIDGWKCWHIRWAVGGWWEMGHLAGSWRTNGVYVDSGEQNRHPGFEFMDIEKFPF